MQVAVIAITRNGARLGARLAEEIPQSRLFVLEKYAQPAAHPFSNLQALCDRLWSDYGGFAFIMAAGIVVRTIAPLLQSKDRDPAVVVIDDAGRFAISLLSGHIGGANALAQKCAEVIGSIPVITTATDVNGLPSFDMLAKAQGWLIEDLSQVKLLNALLLEGREIAVIDATGEVAAYCAGRGVLTFHATLTEAMACGAAGYLLVTNRILSMEQNPECLLVLRPRNLCLGIGCNRGTSGEEIDTVVTEQLERLGLSRSSVRCIGTAQAKSDERGLLDFAASEGVPVLFYESDELSAVEVPSPPSQHALAAIGAKGVAEPAALLTSGGGKLLLHKIKSGNVTLAIAERR